MKPTTIHQRRGSSLRQAVIALYNGMSVCKAATVYRLPKSTIHDAFYAPLTPRVAEHQKRALTNAEEKQIVSLLQRFADKGVPLTRQYVVEAVQRIVESFPLYRRITLPFKNGQPGARFVRSFLRRHKDDLEFVKPLRQEFARFKAVNADVLSQHYSTLEHLVEKYQLDPSRIWNLDECGVTPGRDGEGDSARKHIVTRHGSRDFRSINIGYDKRVTIMPVISAAGETGPCLLVYKGNSFPYRFHVENGQEKIDTIAHHLPRRAVVAMRAEGGGVDSNNFCEWTSSFVDYVSDLTANDRKLLLIYDGYRSHMSLSVLQLFAENNIVIYALPAHTSGKTQPLDVVAFSVFKRKLNDIIFETADRFLGAPVTVFEFTDLLTAAYTATFTRKTIRSSFVRSGVWPVDHKRDYECSQTARTWR